MNWPIKKEIEKNEELMREHKYLKENKKTTTRSK